MAEVTRHETRIEGGTFYVEAEEDWLEVGEVADIVALLGEEYVIEYTDEQAAMDWLDTDEDNRLTIDVRETLETMSYDDEFVGGLAGAPLDRTDEEGVPERTAVYAERMREIFDSKGNLDR